MADILIARVSKTFLVFLFLQFFLSVQSFAQPKKFEFERLSIEDGLSQSSVFSIIQDLKGFMWFGTTDGLNRYDGYQFKSYRFHPRSPHSLSNNRIFCLYEDSYGILWIGTGGGGMNRYDPENDNFLHFLINVDEGLSSSNNYVTKVFEDRLGKLWVGTRGNGLYKFERETQRFEMFKSASSEFKGDNQRVISAIIEVGDKLWIGSEDGGITILDPQKKQLTTFPVAESFQLDLESNFVTALLADGDSVVWIGTLDSGLYKFKPKTHNFKKFPGHEQLKQKEITSLLRNKEGLLWVGTSSGLYCLDENSYSIINYINDPLDTKSLSDNLVKSLYEDRSGVLWVGTSGDGISKGIPEQNFFHVININDNDLNSLNSNIINSVLEDNNKNLFVGNVKGANRIDRKKDKIENIFSIPEAVEFAGVMEIAEDKFGNIWFGTTRSGVITPQTSVEDAPSFPLHLTKENFVIYNNDPYRSSSLSSNLILSIYFDHSGTLWVGTDGAGLNKLLNSRMGEFIRYLNAPNDSTTISDNDVWSIYESPSERDSILWIGTASGGLNKFDRKSKQFLHYKYDPKNPTSISANRVYVIHESPDGLFWIGTDGGLNKFDRTTEKFEYFGTNVGFPNDVIYGILEEDNGVLWLSTNVGLIRFNPNSLQVQSYTTKDGLPSNEFNARSFHKNSEGEFFFGCLDGLVYFNPKEILSKPNSAIPPVVITNFRLFHEVIDSHNDILAQSITTTKEIKLAHTQNTISFEFASLDFTSPLKNKYAFKLEGLEEQWNLTDASFRIANYTKLQPGNYTLRVKGSNNDGIWNEEGTSLKITILPPWWKTWWAYSIYAALILGTFYGLRRYEFSRQRFKHQMELEHVEAEKFQELDRMKSRFFANISHEFRTPLTLISGPVQQLLSGEYNGNVKEQYHMILRNTRRLLRLVNQLLDISRLESGKMKLQARPENIVELTRKLTMAFESLAIVNKIELRFTGPEESLTVYLDWEHYEKIITNLLFNALKFTPAGGEVAVDLSETSPHNQSDISNPKSPISEFVQIRVKDTGSGISADHLPHIFDRFYQAGDTYVKDTHGSGIGLALTKELVELHYGTIKVSREVGKGTEFTVRLPLGKEHLKPEEILSETEIQELDVASGITPLASPLIGGKEEGPQSTTSNDKFILIVEDNSDMRAYIRDILEQSYKVVEAADGQIGFEKAAEVIPDVIISDVMMPEMDGFQFCEKIKTDERTSHIPVILLTAKSSGESKVEGLETGADDYLIKPFDASELRVRVKNLIEQRRKLRERFRQEITLEPHKIAITSADANFLQRVMDAVEKHIESEFGVTELSNEVGMSRSQLHRKLRALTDQSPVGFIRTVRLKRAAALLEHHSGNISEVAYQVGFNNPAYFAECFRKLFGISPKEYASQSKN
jgi:signal transduction histidine kinase/ligand-binding sensor domain-containing protein/DNA-binding response OmpR family regulator